MSKSSTAVAHKSSSDSNNSAGLSAKDIHALNDKYHSLSIEARIQALYKDFSQDKVMLTSSFAATSAYLLHIFSRFAPTQKVYFIDTGFHFPDTLAYKEKLTKMFNLKVEDVCAEAWKHEYTVKDETWKTDPDFCCSINKVEPLHNLQGCYDIWVSGLMRWQTEHRATLDIFEERNGIIKFYPLVDVSKEERDLYIKEHDLPFHPLVAQGYSSIGCTHCTKPGDDRSGRWNNSPKTECGLHL
ncbi:MAG: phosphoadenylyl-sulfate reductase [Gammaproteobacteria bacterium]|nr:phosphoadenylyl-sulfate reductase [Gammaproteobacteria bacterium]